MRTVPESVRARLHARSGSRCERCGILQKVGLHVSHRQAKQMGGRRENWTDLSQWNLLCSNCHLGHVERWPYAAASYGWKVHRWRSTLSEPCKTTWGWAFLTRDGAYAWPPVLPDQDWHRSSR